MVKNDQSETKSDNLVDGIANIDDEIKKQIYELSKSLTSGIRKWEKVMYPMMVGFIILAIYGFYLIYNVTHDMSKISKSVSEMNFTVSQMSASIFQMVTITGVQMDRIDTRMGEINQTMNSLNDGVSSMSKNISSLTTDISSMNGTLIRLNTTLDGMYESVYYMGQTTGQMNSNFSELNQNISKPLDSMNNVMPWSMFGSKKYSDHKNRYQAPPRAMSYTTYNSKPVKKEASK